MLVGEARPVRSIRRQGDDTEIKKHDPGIEALPGFHQAAEFSLSRGADIAVAAGTRSFAMMRRAQSRASLRAWRAKNQGATQARKICDQARSAARRGQARMPTERERATVDVGQDDT